MREYHQKKKLRQRIFSKISILILAVIIVFLAKAALNVYQKNRESTANLNRVNSNLIETQKRYDSLVEETERLKTNEGIEEEMRQKFQVSKEGEKVIVIIDDRDSNQGNATSTSLFSRLKHAILSFIKR